jgi:hypothetical protein
LVTYMTQHQLLPNEQSAFAANILLSLNSPELPTS